MKGMKKELSNMKLKRIEFFLIVIAAIVGLGSGICWFWIGETLDNAMNNFLAWFIAPAVIPLTASAILYMSCLKGRDRLGQKTSLVKSVCFFGLYYVCHWIPMALVIGYSCFKGGF
jgi:cytochrome bd-type quinol oxidase subunit 2